MSLRLQEDMAVRQDFGLLTMPSHLARRAALQRELQFRPRGATHDYPQGDTVCLDTELSNFSHLLSYTRGAGGRQRRLAGCLYRSKRNFEVQTNCFCLVQ